MRAVVQVGQALRHAPMCGTASPATGTPALPARSMGPTRCSGAAARTSALHA